MTLDENGPCALRGPHDPCALLGLANVLLLCGSMSFPDTQTTTSSTDLLEQIADLLLSSTPAGAASPDVRATQLVSALTFLEHLPRGIELEVKFTGVTSFAPTPVLDVFSILGVPLYHACLPDPAHTNVAAVVGDLSHAELIEKIMTYMNSDDPFKRIQANQAQLFLGTAPNQITAYGLSQLTQSMEEGELGVLFRNHHFATICKRNGVIYQLVTHEWYLNRDDMVWQTLNTIDGVGKFVNHDFKSDDVITIVDNYETCKNVHSTENSDMKIVDMCNNLRTEASTYMRSAGVGNNLGLVDMDHVEESIDESSGFPKVCPSGHQLKEVPVSFRLEEQRSGYGRWSCSSCKNDTLGLEGTRFRCDYHKVKKDTTPSVVSFRSGGEWRGSMECNFDLCGECFYAKPTKTDTIDYTEENVEYRNHVIENIKELLLEHPNGIFERNFISIYRDAFGERIDFQKLGYSSQKANMLKFLQTLVGSVLDMEYKSDSRLYIKPSKSLLNEIVRSRMESLSLLEAREHLPNESVGNVVFGVRKQVQYPPDMDEGTNLDIVVSHVMSPAKFWFQLQGQETSDAFECLIRGKMSMLSEPRRRQKWTLNPRGNLWSKDENKLGNKLMEKMGWETGKGLGAKQDGMLEPIQVKKKEDNKGIGFEGHDDTWLAHQDDFQAVLAALNEAHNGGVENDKPKEADDEDTEKRSLEKASKKSKKRVHYHKFTRGKDLANYSANDLGSILGTNSAKRNPKLESEPSTPEQEESEEETVKDDKFTVQKSSVQEYFAKKMAELRAKGKPVLLPEEYHPIVKVSNAKKLDDNGDIVDKKNSDNEKMECEDPSDEAVVKKKKKSKREKKGEDSCDAVDDIAGTEDVPVQLKKKKKKSKKNKEPKDTSNGETDFTEEISKNPCDMTVEITDSSQDTLEASKKEKDKVPEEEVKEDSSSTDQEDSSQKKKKKKKTKKSKRDKNDEETTPDELQNDSGCEQTEQKTRKKKREKKKKDKVSPHDDDYEPSKRKSSEDNLDEEEAPRKKSKKEKKQNSPDPNNPLPSDYQELPGFKGSNILALPGYGTKK